MRLFVDNLTNVDFSYLDAERGLLGETWLASLELEGELDAQGMVCDFGLVKKTVRQWLDSELDHRLLVARHSPSLHWRENGTALHLEWRDTGGATLICDAPAQAVTLVDTDSIDCESVAQWCMAQLKPLFPASVSALRLRFQWEAIDGPYYHYSHGLKKHAGNCQRIAHGHRSRIEIWRDGQLDLAAMQSWAERWRDIYIGSEDDLVACANSDDYAFRYRAQQGDFYLQLAKSRCYLIASDSTVECLAQHIAAALKHQRPEAQYTVKAYEGMGKGAIA